MSAKASRAQKDCKLATIGRIQTQLEVGVELQLALIDESEDGCEARPLVELFLAQSWQFWAGQG